MTDAPERDYARGRREAFEEVAQWHEKLAAIFDEYAVKGTTEALRLRGADEARRARIDALYIRRLARRSLSWAALIRGLIDGRKGHCLHAFRDDRLPASMRVILDSGEVVDATTMSSAGPDDEPSPLTAAFVPKDRGRYLGLAYFTIEEWWKDHGEEATAVAKRTILAGLRRAPREDG